MPAFQSLTKALLTCENQEEVAALLRDLFTIEEIEEATRRFEVARRLAGRETYRKIAAETGVSTTTITRIAYWYHHGMGGYRNAIQALHDQKP